MQAVRITPQDHRPVKSTGQERLSGEFSLLWESQGSMDLLGLILVAEGLWWLAFWPTFAALHLILP